MKIDQDNLGAPWEQQPDEPDRWFVRFYKYARMLGVEYTITRAYRLWLADEHKDGEGTEHQLWREMSTKWVWAERAKAWQEQEFFVKKQMWLKRREELLNADWDTGYELRKVAVSFLKQIALHKEISRSIDEATGNEVVTLAVNISPGDLARLMKTSSELQRLGVGEPTSIAGTAQPGIGIYLPRLEEPKHDQNPIPSPN